MTALTVPWSNPPATGRHEVQPSVERNRPREVAARVTPARSESAAKPYKTASTPTRGPAPGSLAHSPIAGATIVAGAASIQLRLGLQLRPGAHNRNPADRRQHSTPGAHLPRIRADTTKTERSAPVRTQSSHARTVMATRTQASTPPPSIPDVTIGSLER